MKKIFILLVIAFLLTDVVAQTDTTWLLKSVEVTSSRLNRYAIGQTQIDFDSATISRFQNQTVADLIGQMTPLSIKTYGAGLATIAMRGTSASHTALLWNGFDIRPSMSGNADLSILPNAFEKMNVKNGGCSEIGRAHV